MHGADKFEWVTAIGVGAVDDACVGQAPDHPFRGVWGVGGLAHCGRGCVASWGCCH